MPGEIIYKEYALTTRKEKGGYRVDIKPPANSSLLPTSTMLFEREEDALAHARSYVDQIR